MSSVYYGIILTEATHKILQQTILKDYNSKISGPTQVRGCQHPLTAGANFCAQCGKNAYIPNPQAQPLTLEELEEMSVCEFDLPTIEYFTPYFGRESESEWLHIGLGISVKKLVETETLVEAKNRLIKLILQEAGITTKAESIKFYTANHR